MIIYFTFLLVFGVVLIWKLIFEVKHEIIENEEDEAEPITYRTKIFFTRKMR